MKFGITGKYPGSGCAKNSFTASMLWLAIGWHYYSLTIASCFINLISQI
jgi:hypothetical protein